MAFKYVLPLLQILILTVLPRGTAPFYSLLPNHLRVLGILSSSTSLTPQYRLKTIELLGFNGIVSYLDLIIQNTYLHLIMVESCSSLCL